MSSASFPVKKAVTQEMADGSGPSKASERELRVVARKAVNRATKTATVLFQRLDVFILLLGKLKVVQRPLSVKNTPEIWRAHWEELRDAVIEIYDLADRMLELALQAEEHVSTATHEALMMHTNVFRRGISDLVPQQLHDDLVGKGKDVAKSD
ncbi:hypothetical protein BDP81DRAFT_396338 [Colletotrichum phormii]|uniref:Uncharacterized protein n=1 Tax=Colletotrichum phormii TaxID=359342 RepID=A0AAJ0ECU7_9PEZI|nr:uncharacterized protein BDP81DRAFT_396338 [Colletotrichum phormii]KAK1634359.1 hypothetical protein BDP81DRAFT_396338 [Colletotrichum phormii]